MSFVVSSTRRVAALALFAALAFVALPSAVHAEGDAVSVTGTVENGPDGSIAIVSEEGGRFVIVAPQATTEAIRAHAGKIVTAQGIVAKDEQGHSTLTVTSFEPAGS